MCRPDAEEHASPNRLPMTIKELENAALDIEESLKTFLTDVKDSTTDAGSSLVEAFALDRVFSEVLRTLELEDAFKLAKEHLIAIRL